MSLGIGLLLAVLGISSLAWALVWSRQLRSAERERRALTRADEESHRESEEKYRNLFDRSNDGIVLHDDHGRVVDANPRALEILGYAGNELRGKRLDELHPPAVLSVCRAAFDRVHEEGFARFEVDFSRRDGGSFPADVSASRFEIRGQPVVQCILRDVTERRRAEAAERRLTEIADVTTDLVAVFDREGEILYLNRAGRRMVGLAESGELSEVRLSDLYSLESGEILMSRGLPMAAREGFWRGESEVSGYDGRRIAVSQLILAHRSPSGEVEQYSTIARDITDLKEAERELRRHTLRDVLTDLPNRTLFLDRLKVAVSRAHRHGEFALAVLALDLDRFKLILDSLGPTKGDEVLVSVARLLERCVRPGDTAARLGRDQFAVLLADVSGLREAVRIAERIQKELATPHSLGSEEVFTQVGIGVAFDDQGVGSPEEILRHAGMAMYRAKAEGTSQVEVFDPSMHATAVARLRLDSDLRRAVEREEFELFFEPVVSLTSGRLAGFEALLRWRHPERGMLLPGDFLEQAEEAGLIAPIGGWVLAAACHQARAWREAMPDRPLAVGVNLFSRQLTEPELVKSVERVLDATGSEPENLWLEVTESVLIEAPEAVHDVLTRLRRRGVRIFIDDFGTGYSSLSYLHTLPADCLKIDRSFTHRLGGDRRSLEIVRAIVQLAHNLEMQVLAEGVESAEHYDALRALDCEYAQGYFFASPLDSAGAEELIRRQPVW